MSSHDELVPPQAAVAPGYLTNQAARIFNRVVDAALRPHDMSLGLLGPLLLLSWKGSMLQRDLVRASAVKQPAMVALLDKLQAMNLIERTRTSHDRRAAWVNLTERGFELAQIGGDALIEANRLALQDFTAEETDLLVNLSQRLIANLQQADMQLHQQ